VQEHRDILEAIASRDSDAAERLTEEHIKNAKHNFLDKHDLPGELGEQVLRQ
jgi:DNA-binding GntR family transcriptional regulator